MLIEQKADAGTLTVALEGHLDTISAPELQYAVKLGGVKELRLDLSKLTYLSSAGVRVLLIFQKELAKTGGSMRLGGVRPEVMNVFVITGMNGIFQLDPAPAKDASVAS